VPGRLRGECDGLINSIYYDARVFTCKEHRCRHAQQRHALLDALAGFMRRADADPGADDANGQIRAQVQFMFPK
jgi:hypothetical protein